MWLFLVDFAVWRRIGCSSLRVENFNILVCAAMHEDCSYMSEGCVGMSEHLIGEVTV